jgi:tyrosine-specific transport protein
MTKQPSILGGALLVVGSCVGAGMLGLPIMTGLCGFYPSLILFILAGVFMTLTALLLVEVQQQFDHPVNLGTMCGFSLGKAGRFLCAAIYLFLFYSLLVAYTALAGHHTSMILNQLFKVNVPSWGGSLFFVTLFGSIVYHGTRPVDLTNRFFMVFKILSFVALIYFASQHLDTSLYDRVQWSYFVGAIPIMIIAFGFHNMVPSLVQYYDNQTKKILMAIIFGALFTFSINLIWQIISLGTIPMFGVGGLQDSFEKGVDAAQSMAIVLSLPSIQIFSNLLAFFAIMTSFVAQALSLVHFLQDIMKVKGSNGKESLAFVLIALLPPLTIAVLGPNVFFSALNFAGGICAVALFGIAPVLMCWVKRYRRGNLEGYQVLGGKPILVVLGLFSLFVMGYQLLEMMGTI